MNKVLPMVFNDCKLWHRQMRTADSHITGIHKQPLVLSKRGSVCLKVHRVTKGILFCGG